MVAHFTFVVAEETFAAVGDRHTPLAFSHLPKTPSNSPSMGRTWRGASGCLAGIADEVEDGTKFFVGELEVGIGGGPAYGEDGEDAPTLDAFADEILTDVGQAGEIATGDASDDIIGEMWYACEHCEGLVDSLETLGIASHPVVVGLESVETEGDGAHACLDQTHKSFGGKGKSVGDHSPRESFGVDGCTAFFKVGAHEGFASRYDDEDLMGVGLCCDAVEHTEEVVLRHIGLCGLLGTVASAMTAAEVASEGALPKQLLQGMFLQHVLFAFAPEFERNLFS